MQTLLQSALAVALSIIRANTTVLEGLGAYLEGNHAYCFLCMLIVELSLVIVNR